MLLASCGSKSDPKSEFLKCNKSWGDRTEFEKIIGKWCGKVDQPGVGRRAVTQNMKFQTIYCFYSDHTMKKFMLTDSYVDFVDEMDSGTDVKVNGGVLTYISAKYGSQKYNISVSESGLIFGRGVTYSKCN